MSKSRVSDREYLSLSAMIKAREAKMPNRERLERILEGGSFAECARQLEECGYPDFSGLDADGLDAAISALREELFSEMEKALPEKCIIEAFRLKYDVHNAKVLIKSRAANVDAANLLSEAGNVPTKEFIEVFHNEEYSRLPQWLGSATEYARGLLARTANPQLADVSLDKAYFAQLVALGQQETSGFLTKYVQVLIDSVNLRTLVRTKRMAKDADFLRGVLIEGGSKDVSVLIGAVLGGSVAEAFSGSVFEQAALSAENVGTGGSLTRFELECDNAVTAFLESAKLVGFGAEPIIAFIAAKEQEYTNVRMILTGKLSGIEPGVIRERLRDTYA